MLSRLSRVQLVCSPMDCSLQAPLSMGFSSQESCGGAHALLQGSSPNSGSNPHYPTSPALAGRSAHLCHPGSPHRCRHTHVFPSSVHGKGCNHSSEHIQLSECTSKCSFITRNQGSLEKWLDFRARESTRWRLEDLIYARKQGSVSGTGIQAQKDIN